MVDREQEIDQRLNRAEAMLKVAALLDSFAPNITALVEIIEDLRMKLYHARESLQTAVSTLESIVHSGLNEMEMRHAAEDALAKMEARSG